MNGVCVYVQWYGTHKYNDKNFSCARNRIKKYTPYSCYCMTTVATFGLLTQKKFESYAMHCLFTFAFLSLSLLFFRFSLRVFNVSRFLFSSTIELIFRYGFLFNDTCILTNNFCVTFNSNFDNIMIWWWFMSVRDLCLFKNDISTTCIRTYSNSVLFFFLRKLFIFFWINQASNLNTKTKT